MITKKKLRAQIDLLIEENEHLLIDYEALSGEYIETNRKENQLLGENAKLVSQQTELLNALQRKQNQLDDEIASRLDFEGMYQSLKKANFDQSKKIVTLLNALNSLRTRLYLVCDSVGTAVVDIDKAFDPPV